MRHWTTATLKTGLQYDAWADGLNASHLSWSLGPPEITVSGRYHAEFSSRSDTDFSVVNCACDPCHGTRGSREIGQNDDAFYGVLVLRSGHEEVLHSGDAVTLGAGDMMIWDASRPCRFRAHTAISKTTLFVSRSRLRALGGSDRLNTGLINVSAGWGRLLRDRVLALEQVIGSLDNSTFARLADSLIGEVALLAQPQRHVAKRPRRILLDRIDRAMDARLADPDFGPPELAASVGISVSYLHHLFRDETETVRSRILRKRLDAVAQMLQAPASARGSLTQIAFAHGFSSAAHFSRSFKLRFGCSPRAFREDHRNIL
ncbi:helix-turn-helix domain-containing protein [Denitrobaculum tricleocarpae]|uniref:helix-turn-helix domain-containing protein n=1 Tax=Denitrobaculum tricleocarpae TaxID=2591009 RepID=UPI0015D17416|nr:helix-turn-helix domain-containing protein [Denitrobaculum tricleocarpae]